MMARTNGNATDVEQRGPAVSTASHSPTRAYTFVEVSAPVVSTGRRPVGAPTYDGSDSPASLRQRAARPAQESGHAVDTTARSRRSGRARRASAPAVPRVELRPHELLVRHPMRLVRIRALPALRVPDGTLVDPVEPRGMHCGVAGCTAHALLDNELKTSS